MVQAGGSATVYGVLYQMLRAAHWAATIHLKATVDSDDLSDAQLILEPQGGGGDVLVISPKKRIVEQLKAKSGKGTWSLKSLVSEVLPDLVRAVPPSSVDISSVYRFVTEGRAGLWGDFLAFQNEVKEEVPPADSIAALDDTEELKFFPGKPQTRRSFFQGIVSELRTHPDLASDSVQITASKLRQVLSAFEFHDKLSTSIVMKQLQELLLHVVDHREDVPGKIDELVGMTMRLAAQGNVSLSSQDLLRQAGITSLPLGNWPILCEQSREIVDRETTRTFRYQVDLDVRETPDWPDDQPILILHGESGQGKTWQLAALARQLSSYGELVAVISSRGNASEDLIDASRMVWGRIANHDHDLPLDRISARIRDNGPKLQNPWLHLFIDNVSSVSHARQLMQFDWKQNGIRLAISTTAAIAESLKRTHANICHSEQVTDFTSEQLQEYLERRGQEWGLIPPDVRQTLRRPLLAQLFCEVAAAQGPVPESEYDLFEQYWNRIRNAKHQADYPQDITRILALARGTIRSDSDYPWLGADLAVAGIDDAGQVRLEQIGWLQRLEDGRVKVWHDRLLNWAVAESLLADFRSGQISIEGLTERFTGLSRQDRAYRDLPFVPLDILWLLATPGAINVDAVCSLIATYSTTGHHIEETFWKHDLPTLGERIIAPTVAFLERLPKQSSNLYPRWCAFAISGIDKRQPGTANEWAVRLISSTNDVKKYVAIHLLEMCPTSACLDQLWIEHVRSCERFKQGSIHGDWQSYQLTSSALRACVGLSPKWLADRIESLTSPSRMAAELAYLLASLRNEAGATIWQQTKRHLFRNVPLEKQRSLATCISSYRDHDEVETLRSWVPREDDSIGSSSLAALSRMDPVATMLCVKQLNSWDRYLARTWWLPELMLRCPVETDQLVCELFAEQPEEFWRTANLFQGQEHLIGKQSLIAMLEKLSEELALELADPPPATRRSLYAPLAVLSCIRCPELVCEFERRKGTPLEDQLVRIAIPWIGRHGNVLDREYHAARRVLWLIGGTGIREVIRAELKSTNKHARIDGIKLSPLVADESIGTLLVEISRKEEFWDEQGLPFEQLEATVSLAEIGDNQSVIESVLRRGDFFDTLLRVLRNRSMANHEFEAALQVVTSGERSRLANGLRALGVTGRGDLAPYIYGQVLTDVDGKTLQAAVSAAFHLKDKSDDAFQLYSRGLDIPECRGQSVRGLQAFLPDSLPIFIQWLDKNGLTPGDHVGDVVSQVLFAYPETQAVASRHVLASLQEQGGHALSSHLLRCLTDTDLETLKATLLEIAYAPESGLHIVGHRIAAIHAFSRIDRDAAIRAAEIALARTTKDRDLLPDLLMALDEPRAIRLLVENVSAERSTAAIWAMGRALRHAASQDLVVDEIKQRFASKKWQDQLAACLMAGWLQTSHFEDELMSYATDSLDMRVSDAARMAIQRKSDENGVLVHFDQLKVSSGIRAWSRLEAAIGMADPILLVFENDPLWIGHALKGHSAYLQTLSRDRIEKRRTEIKQQAQKRDSDQD